MPRKTNKPIKPRKVRAEPLIETLKRQAQELLDHPDLDAAIIVFTTVEGDRHAIWGAETQQGAALVMERAGEKIATMARMIARGEKPLVSH
jgi:hypothetical protein